MPHPEPKPFASPACSMHEFDGAYLPFATAARDSDATRPTRRIERWRLERTAKLVLVAGFALLAAWLLAACGENGGSLAGDDAEAAGTSPLPPAASVEQPEGWADDLALTEAQDFNPDPDIVEINLESQVSEIEILPGLKTPAWTYGGTVPGPLIRAKVGDRVIIHFKNSLPESTSIHWHGLRVPNGMDGVPGVTQPPVEAGGEFRYEFTVRDAGTYWYHPHINSAAQVGWGMYGAFVVEDPNDLEAFGDDLVMVLSDMSLDDLGGFLPKDNGGQFGDLFGREGNILLVNGKHVPTLKVRAGKPQRWRIIDAARARYYTISVPGHELIRLGGDNGLAERSVRTHSVIVTPSERQDVVFIPSDEPGTHNMLKWIPTDRGFGSTFNRARKDMLAIETVDEPPVQPAPIPEHLRDIEPIDVTNAVERDIELTIDFDSQKNLYMGINHVPYSNVKPIETHLGQTEIWNVINNTDFAHPFHIHGYFFQVLDDSRVPEWKDTVNVPVDSVVRIAVRFDERPGMWMYHCHILDHAEVGMMGQIHVAAD
jgi:FtsP/CotA-like multicopper oxidase with cupredoxin domain